MSGRLMGAEMGACDRPRDELRSGLQKISSHARGHAGPVLPTAVSSFINTLSLAHTGPILECLQAVSTNPLKLQCRTRCTPCMSLSLSQRTNMGCTNSCASCRWAMDMQQGPAPPGDVACHMLPSNAQSRPDHTHAEPLLMMAGPAADGRDGSQ